MYVIGNVLTMLAGLISFPVFTRILSPSEYGLFNLINLTSALLIALTKGGLQQALQREWQPAQNIDQNISTVSTAFWGSLAICLVVFAILGLGSLIVTGKTEYSYPLITAVLFGLVSTEVCKSIICNTYVASRKALEYNIILIVAKYTQIGVAIGFLFLFGFSAIHLLLGFIGASLVLVGYLVVKERKYLAWSAFSMEKYRSMLLFGVPLIVYELTNQLLTFADRYFIGVFMGTDAVGKYSAAYNLTFYIQTVFITSISLTVYPACIELKNKEDINASRQFLHRVLPWYVMIASAVTLGFCALDTDIFLLAASSKYAEATVVLSPVMFGAFFFGLFTIASTEFFIAKQTMRLALLMGGGAVLNMILNILLVPSFGLIGAAYASLVPEVLLAAAGLSKLGILKDGPALLILAPYTIPSCIMYGILISLPGQLSWLSIFFRIILGILVWLLAVLLLNSEVRQRLVAWRKRNMAQ